MYLKMIGETYYFYRRCPEFLKDIIPSRFISFSLKTNNKEYAQILEKKISYCLEEVSFALRIDTISKEEAGRRLQKVGVRVCTLCQAKIKPAPEVFNKPKGQKASWLFERYKEQRIREGRWVEKTALENSSCAMLFFKVAGDHSPTYYTHQMLMNFKSVLQQLPPKMNIMPKTRGKSIARILAMRHEKLLSVSQINKYLICIGAYFRWLTSHEYISSNPAHHLLLSKSKKTRPEDERGAFSVNEMRKIRDLLREQKESFKPWSSRFWVPFIAIYSGMRVAEISGLYLSDIKKYDGIWCFDVNDENDKRLKTAASRRKVPIHPCILAENFLDYWAEKFEEGQERLFPDIKREKFNGYGRQVSKYFSKWNRRYITKDPLLTLYSGRHSIANELKQCGVASEVISELLGHQIESITISRYGKRYRPEILLEAIKKLPW